MARNQIVEHTCREIHKNLVFPYLECILLCPSVGCVHLELTLQGRLYSIGWLLYSELHVHNLLTTCAPNRGAVIAAGCLRLRSTIRSNAPRSDLKSIGR